jgi:ubiquitin carboxyl-terminal hydrolase 14
MRNIPEFRDALAEYRPVDTSDPAVPVAAAMKDLFVQMSAGGDSVYPAQFVNMFRQTFPQYAEQSRNSFVQQDADECWNTLAQVMKSQLRTPDGGNKYDELFMGQMKHTLTCVENPDDSSTEVEAFWKLPCFVDREVTFVNQGIQRGLEGSIEKQSEILGCQANYSKVSRISRLPTYLLVAFNRFDSKSTSDGVIGLKVLKPISFPAILDVHQLCDDELKGSILSLRGKLTEIRELEMAKKGTGHLELRDVDKKKAEEAMDVEEETAPEEEAPAEEPVMDLDMPENPQIGYYDLKGVVTHKGRALSSGHYMGFAKEEKDGHSKWVKYDDDDVYEVTKEDIMKLNGGGD